MDPAVSGRTAKAGMLSVGLAVILVLAGCAVLPERTILGERPPTEVGNVPVYMQSRYQCGPASLAMVMAWGGAETTPEALVPIVFSPGLKGSIQPSMIAAARRQGFLAVEISGLEALYEEMAAGHPVIVLEDLGALWMHRWHYSVAVGIAPSRNRIVLHTGRDAPQARDLDRFLKSWSASDYWGLVVLPPGRLPSGSSLGAVLNAILGLEQSGHPEGAAASYRTALARWPESPEVRFGLGNSLYQSGDRAGARKSFRELCDRAPAFAPGCNNLAHVLMEDGRLDEALSAAEKALAAGGAQDEIYRETLEEIRSAIQSRKSRPGN
ncbi:MAG: PA2778 family cysteine peptidase [Desulfobacterales bacterium]